MYRSWSALWFGWTKNLYLGANRSWGMMVYLVNYLFIRNRNLAALQFAPLGCRDF
jgi:hypothetical protein